MQTNEKNSDIERQGAVPLHRAIFTLIWGLLIAFSAAGANSPYIVKVQHYSLGEGLPNRGVMTIGQDRQGFVWIGTLSNAFRFDNYTFKALPYSLHSMPKENEQYLAVHSIQTDSEGNLWIVKNGMGTQNHLAILPAGQSEFVSFEQLFKRPPPFDFSKADLQFRLYRSPRPGDPILFLTVDGSIWFYEGKGRFKQFYRHPKRTRPKSVLISPTGNFLLTYALPNNPNQNELIELTGNGHVHRRQLIPAYLDIISVDSLGSIYLSSFFDLKDMPKSPPRLSRNQGKNLLYRLDRTGELHNIPVTWFSNPFPDPVNYSFANTRMVYDATHGLFWFMGPNVLFAWHPRDGIVFNLASTGFPVASLIEFHHLFVDKTGAVWVSTQNGFLLLTLERNQFQRLLYSPENEVTPFKFSTRGIVKAGNWLWVNTHNGSRLIDLKTGNTHKPQNLVQVDLYKPAILGHDNKIWTTPGDTLAQIDIQTQTTRKFSLNKYQMDCWALWQDHRHNFWLGYDDGIVYFDLQKQKAQPFTRYNRYPELARNRVHGFAPDPKTGGIWVAASTGLYLLDPLRGITARYSTKDAPPNHLPADHISFVYPDRTQPGIYWLASRLGGLIRWERSTGKWQHFTQEHGLSNDGIYSIHEDRHGRLWLPSNFGLMRFNKYTHQVQNYLPKDGIAHEEFNLTSNFQSTDGQLFLGGLNGITAFWPDKELTEKPVTVPLMLTHYEQLNANTGERINYLPEFDQKKQILIPPKNRSFSLAFSLLDYRYGRQFRLSYRIVNWQDYWTSQLHRDITINGLPPGNYQLEVRAQNPNGDWVSKTLTIPITVLKPFYLQTWFLTLIVLGLIGSTIGFFQWRNHRLSQETKRLEEEVSRRTAQIEKDKAVIEQQAADLQANATLKARFFANVSHEFRTPLTLLLGPLAYLSKRTTEPVTARLLAGMDRNARQLLAMVSDLLDLSKLDVNPIQLTKQPADLCSLINRVVASFASQAEFSTIHLTATGATKPLWLSLDVAKMETVLKNLLANALHFTPAGGSVTIRLHEPTDEIRIEVSDTGSGIHPNDLPHIFERYYQSQQPDAPLRGGTGIGLALSMEYCKLWGGNLTVDSTLGKGSTFALTCPYQPTAPQKTVPAPETKSPEPVLAEVENNGLSTRILLVEDNTDMAEYLETILSPYYLLHVTRNGREAWQWLSALPVADQPKLIVTDLMMPDMDGLALVNQIRRQPTVRAIPVLMLTARTSQDVKIEALRLGVADYVTKPFDQDELITRISNLLERSQERTAWQQQLPAETAGSSVPMDEEWLQQIEQLVLKNLTNTQFQVHSIADAVHSSERQLYRRLKKLTGFSPNQFMQEIRLQTAREWLENQQYGTVKEVCYAVGFQDPVYFSRLFLNRFGRYPATFLRTAEVS